jgi:hypothetical protein
MAEEVRDDEVMNEVEEEEGLINNQQENEVEVVEPQATGHEGVAEVDDDAFIANIIANIPERLRSATVAALADPAEQERARKRTKLEGLLAQTAELQKELGEPSSGVSLGTDRLADRVLHGMLASLAGRRDAVPVQNAAANSSMARALNKPSTWEHDMQGTRRAAWLKQIEAFAIAHQVEPHTILPSYLGPSIAALYDGCVLSWQNQGKAPSWHEACAAFKTIVGQQTELEQAKTLDDLAQLRIKQLPSQSLFAYKVKLQHKIMVAGDINTQLQIHWFINGLGSEELRAEMQPELMSGRIQSVDEAFDLATGKERMLAGKHVKPFGQDPHTQAGKVGSVQAHQATSKPTTASHKNAKGEPICVDCNKTMFNPEPWCKRA